MSTPPASSRWPLHPPPGPLEALSSWLDRLAARYGLSRRDLLRHNLGPTATPYAKRAGDALDKDPPTALLTTLAESTGIPIPRLRLLTIAGWVPWLLDSLTGDSQAMFETYIRAHSVLLAPGEIPHRTVGVWRPWLPIQPLRRICPVCARNPDHAIELTAHLPLMSSCITHGCRLLPKIDVLVASILGESLTPEPVTPSVAALDQRTHEGLITGRVTLPRRSVHVGVWFRLLRTLLEEISTPLSHLHAGSRRALRHVWMHTAHPVRAGLSTWRPYEQLDWSRQQAFLHATAAALQLVETGSIAAHGALGPLLTLEPHDPVHDGDPPIPSTTAADNPGKQVMDALTAGIDTARTESAEHY